MRCPKCGYISFDHLETCKKCQKYIGDVGAEINGTTYNAETPLFLKITSREESTPSLLSQKTRGMEARGQVESDDSFELGESEETEFVLDHEFDPEPQRKEIDFPGGKEDFVMELNDIGDISPRDEFTLDLGEQSDGMKSQLPSMDFGDLDISDLAPPIKEESEPIQFAEEPVLSDLEPVASLSQSHPPPSTSSEIQSGLEDLNFNGLDLDTPAKLVSGSVAGKRFLPSVKTGTALDKFDIDLGNLFAENKK
ncbi:hypothetical protein [uncultured Desulfobulbus sp.]|uniref:hypothetical protein n=1 Tax=uncultured Desulfobulbus sp. TaxID=239745 RepID=UPI0029C64037|nr:hypothetical protein [uncultured Desulfobulbus sp.]